MQSLQCTFSFSRRSNLKKILHFFVSDVAAVQYELLRAHLISLAGAVATWFQMHSAWATQVVDAVAGPKKPNSLTKQAATSSMSDFGHANALRPTIADTNLAETKVAENAAVSSAPEASKDKKND